MACREEKGRIGFRNLRKRLLLDTNPTIKRQLNDVARNELGLERHQLVVEEEQLRRAGKQMLGTCHHRTQLENISKNPNRDEPEMMLAQRVQLRAQSRV